MRSVLPALARAALLLAVADCCVAQPEAVARKLAELLAPLSAKTQVGLLVLDLDDGAVWFEHAADRPLKPASVMKLFVSAAALERFGADFKYETRFYLHDDELWVVGAGDPGLGDERILGRRGRTLDDLFDDWAAAVKRATAGGALRKIVLDDSVFDRRTRHPDWPADQAQAWYQAPVGGLNVNDNCLDARVDLRDGRLALRLRPKLPDVFVRNTLRFGGRHKPRIARKLESDIFVLSGSVTRSIDLGPTSAGRPTVFFGHALKLALAARGVSVSGDVVRRRLTPDLTASANPILTHTTNLRDVLWRANTFSQNLFAECLLKSLAAYARDGSRSGEVGSWDRGTAVLRSTLESLGLDTGGATFRDGSGLSHQDRVTAAQVVRLLAIMHRHPLAGVFRESLAAPGTPGTMRRRYDHPDLRGRLRAKTGTIRGVRTIAGYLDRADGARLAFALLINGKAPAELPRAVCRALLAGQ